MSFEGTGMVPASLPLPLGWEGQLCGGWVLQCLASPNLSTWCFTIGSKMVSLTTWSSKRSVACEICLVHSFELNRGTRMPYLTYVIQSTASMSWSKYVERVRRETTKVC